MWLSPDTAPINRHTIPSTTTPLTEQHRTDIPMSTPLNEERIIKLHRLAFEVLGKLEEDFPEYEEQLSKVRFEWSGKMTRAAGNARSTGLIRFSAQIWSIGENHFDAFRNTVLHEIAHIIAGARHGHDDVWKRIAMNIGCTGERCHQLEVPKSKPRQEWPCSVCAETMLLGPRQINKAKRGYSYRHGSCQPRRSI